MRNFRWLNVILSTAVTVSSVLLAIFVFKLSYLRLAETLANLIEALKYYFSQLFGWECETPQLVRFSDVLHWKILPEDFEVFKVRAVVYLEMLFSDNLFQYVSQTGYNIALGSRVLVLVLPAVFAIVIILRNVYRRSNNNYNVDTKPLRVYKALVRWLEPIKSYIKQYRESLASNRYFCWTWLVIWTMNLNIMSIFISAIAFYFYFAVSMDVANLYIQLVKLVVDLRVIFTTVPWWVFVAVGYFVFDKWRQKIANNRLRRFEARNCGFINELPIVSLTCGSMGKKKTTMITDMALSQEVMFRQKALELLQNNAMKFVNFPWIMFELQIKQCMEYHTVYNLATVKQFVHKKRQRYLRNGDANAQLYGYDVDKYGVEYNDGLKISNLFDVMEGYAQLYFVYVIESSLLVSNYSVRTDNTKCDLGNFPMWVYEFFPKQVQTDGRHSHVLDFDALRLGKKVLENNPHSGSLEFVVVVISEVGKERGNNLELREVKKSTEEANQKNDLLNSWLKMCRHSATIDNFPFIKVFTDEQRPESWGADARDLCDVVHIFKSSDSRIAMPFYTIEDMVSDWIFRWFFGMYYDFRFLSGDNCLLVHLLKNGISWVYRRNTVYHNRFDYSVLYLKTERGILDNKRQNKRYYIMNKKIYSNRFCTDCFSDYFNQLARGTKVGLGDWREYLTERATLEELKSQNSYFINSLYKGGD